MRKKKLRNSRPKALFGEVAAAGITAAATLAAAGIGAAATAKAAKEQSAATIENAKQQAASIEATNTNNNQLQQQSQQFIAQENEANRQIQRDLQMSLQLQGGQLDTEQRRMASRIQVKRGGKIKSSKRLRDAQFPLRASDTGIRVTDGGYLEPIGYSPEGYPLYKAHGDTHKQYHKVGKKYKSGIGIKVPGRETIEVENGETIADRLMSPHSDVAIASRLSHSGMYPAQMIDAGAPVDDVIDAQELINVSNGNSPVEGNRYKALAGLATNYILPTDYPINTLGFDMAGINVGAARRQLKKGGRCKAVTGRTLGTFRNWRYPTGVGFSFLNDWNNGYPSSSTTTSPTTTSSTTTNPAATGSKQKDRYPGGRSTLSGNLWGAGLTTLGNIGGALLSNWGTSRAGRALANAYRESSQLLADAYGNLKTIDLSSVSRDTFRNQHYLPVVRSANVNVNDKLGAATRNTQELERATDNTTLSSAARLFRRAAIKSRLAQLNSEIYADKYNREEAIKQANADAINKAAETNAQLDIQSRRDYMGHYLDLLKYNNDIVNERITGRAQALADGVMGAVGARSSYMQSAGQSWANAVANSGQAFGNAFAMDAKQRNDLNMARIGATHSGELAYLKYYGTTGELRAEIERLQGIYNDPNSTIDMKDSAKRDLRYLGYIV